MTQVSRTFAFGTGAAALSAFLLYSTLREALAPALLLPIAATVVVLTAIKPRWGLYATVAALPLLTWVPSAFHTPYFVPAELLTYALLAGWLLHCAHRPQFQWRRSPLDVLLIALVAVILCSMSVEPIWIQSSQGSGLTSLVYFPTSLTSYLKSWYSNPTSTFPLRAASNILVGVILFLLVVQLVETAEQRRRVADLLVVSSLGVSAYGIFQFVFRYRLLRGMHVQSTLSDSNSLGSYLVLVLGIWVGQWLGGGRRKKFLFSIVPGLLLVCLFCTASRAGWVAGTFVLFAFASLLMRPLPPRLRLKVTAFATIVLLLLSIGLLYRARRLDVRQNVYTNPIARLWFSLNPRNSLERVVGRNRYWLAALDALADAPLMGIGIGRFYASPYIEKRLGQWENAHNYFLQLAAELGLIGLMLWLGLLGRWFSHVWHQYKGTNDEVCRWTLLGLGLGVTAYLLTCLVGHPLLLPEQQLLFWCVIGLGVSVHPVCQMSSREKWCLIGFLVVLCVSVFSRFL